MSTITITARASVERYQTLEGETGYQWKDERQFTGTTDQLIEDMKAYTNAHPRAGTQYLCDTCFPRLSAQGRTQYGMKEDIMTDHLQHFHSRNNAR